MQGWDDMKGILEGLLFISGDDGLSLDKIKEVLDIKDDELADLIEELTKSYDNEDRGIRLEVLANKLKLVTKVEYKDYYKKIVDIENDMLTNSALETLAIIAYNQPLTRGMIDDIRGVDSSYHVKKLLIKELICEKGRSELPGRPILYGTTDKFLDHFGLHSLSELPVLEEKEEVIDEEVNLFESKYKEIV